MSEMRRSVLARLASMAMGGAALVAFQGATAGEVPLTVETAITGTEVSVKRFNATGNGVTDDTAAFQAMATAGGRYYVPAGTYVISSVGLTQSVHFVCAPGATFQRKAGTDVQSGSYWNAGAAMFEVNAAGLTVAFTGNPTYDGNKANQTQVEPTGFFLKTYPPATITGAPTYLYMENMVFINGTSGYLALRAGAL